MNDDHPSEHKGAVEDRVVMSLTLPDNCAQRCSRKGHHYLFDGVACFGFRSFLEIVFRKPLREIMHHLYVEQEMSGLDIQKFFTRLFGFLISDRVVHTIIVETGTPVRGYSEHKRLAWKQGKMAGAASKSRHARKGTFILGSRAEKVIRYLLCETFLTLNVPWDVIIGDTVQYIHERFEIDIPVVLVARESGYCCRIAVEVDSAFTHSNKVVRERDIRKENALRKQGWQVVRINADRIRNKNQFAEDVTDLALEIERIGNEYFADLCSRSELAVVQ